jgi:hypothetical protein
MVASLPALPSCPRNFTPERQTPAVVLERRQSRDVAHEGEPKPNPGVVLRRVIHVVHATIGDV